MGELEPGNDSAFKDVSCISCYSTYHVQVSVGDCRNIEVVETDLLQSDTEFYSDEDDLLHEGLEKLHIEQSACSSTSNKMISQIPSPDMSELLTLSKCATMICSEVLQSSPAIFAKAESSTIDLGYQCPLSVQIDAEDGVPLHDPSKLVSALKGSRARHGKPLDPNLHVNWAADVYDPPVTSSSHTVKGHRHQHHHHHHHRVPKSKKDNNKHKHAKSKPPNTPTHSGAERKNYQRRISSSSSSSFLDSRISRLQALPSVSLQAGFVRSKVQQVLEDSNCGGGFHARPSWPFSLPLGEAS